MLKLLLLIVAVCGLSLVVKPQTNNTISPAVAPTPAAASDYSESSQYQPRKQAFKQNKKDKKNDKSKPDKQNQSPDVSAAQFADEKQVLNIPVSVFDEKGMPVTKLEKSDFKLFADEEEVEIGSLQTAEQLSLNVFLILDTSPSVFYGTKELQIFAQEFVAGLESSVKIQIIHFNEKAFVVNELTNDRQILKKAINKIDIGNGTSLYDSISSIMNKQLGSVAGRKVIVLLTDGVDTASRNSDYDDSLVEVEKNDVIVYPFYLDTYATWAAKNSSNRTYIGANRPSMILNGIRITGGQSAESMKADYDLGKNYLSDLTTLSGGKIFQVNDIAKINAASLKKIPELYFPKYYLSVRSSLLENGQRRRQLKVRVNKPNLNVLTKRTYINSKYQK